MSYLYLNLDIIKIFIKFEQLQWWWFFTDFLFTFGQFIIAAYHKNQICY